MTIHTEPLNEKIGGLPAFRDKVEQDYDYDEELEEANAKVDELEEQLYKLVK